MIATSTAVTADISSKVEIPVGHFTLLGDLSVPAKASGIALFAHGSGSSRNSPRNQFVARMLREARVGTLLFDLLTPEEEFIDASTAKLRFDIGLLAHRLIAATNENDENQESSRHPAGHAPTISALQSRTQWQV